MSNEFPQNESAARLAAEKEFDSNHPEAKEFENEKVRTRERRNFTEQKISEWFAQQPL